MAITLEKFAADCHDALKSQPGTPGREQVRKLVEQALADPEFVATYIPPGTPERHLLYEDPELGFAILAHGYVGPKGSKPHDHGPSWAIYGQAAGETIMTDWDCVARPTDGAPGKAGRESRLRHEARRRVPVRRRRAALAGAEGRHPPAADRGAEHGEGEAVPVRGGDAQSGSGIIRPREGASFSLRAHETHRRSLA